MVEDFDKSLQNLTTPGNNSVISQNLVRNVQIRSMLVCEQS